MKTNRSAAAGLTEIVPEFALLRPVPAKARVMSLATLCERLRKLTTPLTAVRLVVPCNTPVPALRLAVTTVELSLERRLPNWSSMRITGCCGKAVPAVAVEEGCV